MHLKKLIPFDIKVAKRLCDMDKHEALAFYEEFAKEIPERIDYFAGVLRCEGIQIEPLTSVSLCAAAEWIVRNTKTSWRHSDLYTRSHFAPFERDLSVPTKSACRYLGLLFGQLMVEKVESASWLIYWNDKRDIYYNYPVVFVPGAKIGPLEPISVSINYVSSRLDKGHPFHDRLFDELFDYWYKSFSPT